jgi:hypothetical protein
MVLVSSREDLVPRKKDNPEERRILDAVDALVQFANLKGGTDAKAFQSSYPSFVPSTFWSTKSSIPDVDEILDTWRIEQARLQKAWNRGFSLNDALKLISNAADQARNALAFDAMERGEPTPNMKLQGFPFQQAVMFMAMHPKLAKICKRCSSYFVADHHLREYCLLPKLDQRTCFAAHRKEYKHKDGQAHGWYRGRKKLSSKKS